MKIYRITAVIIAAAVLMVLPALYAMTMPGDAEDATVAAATEQSSIPSQSGNYTDVKENDWFYNNVAAMSASGYLSGYPDGSFRPNRTISASEFVSIAARAIGLESSAAQNSHWAGGLLQAALDKNIYDWDEIPPTAETYDDPITRQLSVKIIMNAFLQGVSGDYNTETAKISDFAEVDGRYYNAVIGAYSKGIAKGNDRGCFEPKSSLTRAEACALIQRAIQLSRAEGLPGSDSSSQNNGNSAESSPASEAVNTGAGNTASAGTQLLANGGVSENGHLQVIGTQLCNQEGEAVVLRGMSSHGIQWFPQFLAKNVIKSTSDNGANLFRIAMYTDEGGYIANPSVKQTLITAADTAISLDMYTIIDWHILHDGNPRIYMEQAKSFFTEMAEKYNGNPAVIYEICNEPNGNVTWTSDVKPYAEEIIKTIRAIDKNAVILVGSPTWSQDLHEVAKNPIDANNIMYTCHFYAGTHTEWLRTRISESMRHIPVFVSEWGTSDSSGSGGVYLDESQKWIDFMNKNKISWANWSLCDKNESSAAVKSGANITDGISTDELTQSGRFVWDNFQ